LIETAGGSREERHRHEHRHQDDADDHDRAEHLAHRVERRLHCVLAFLAHMPLDVLDDHDGIVYDDARREHDAEQRQRIDGEIESVEKRKGADQRHGDGDRRDDCAAPLLEEQKHHQHHERDRFTQRLQHLDDRLAHDAHVVERDAPQQPRRKGFLEPRHLVDDTLEGLEGIRTRKQLYAQACRIKSAKAKIRRIGFGAKLDAAHVAHPHQRAVAARLDDDVFELLRLAQPPHRPHADLVQLLDGRGRVAQRARRNLQVLLAQRVDDVTGRQLARRKLGWVEPETHRELALTELNDVADTGDALDRILDIHIDVVADELRAVTIVLGVEAKTTEKPGRVLGHRHTQRANVGGQTADGLIDAILHVDRRQVVIATDIEGRGDRRDTAVGARRRHVHHALDAVDRLLERRGDRAFNGLRVRARVKGGHRDRRRRELRIPRNRQVGNGNGAREDDQKRADCRQDRAANEEIAHHGWPACFDGAGEGAALDPSSVGLTGMPSPIF
jgi:hypothetical protein